MVEKSLVSVAYEILSEDYNNGKTNPKPFLELCSEICSRVNLTEEEFMKLVSRFYTDLTLDGRFVIKENNTWVLREHVKYKELHTDMNKAYSEMVDDDEFDENGKKKSEENGDDVEESELFNDNEDDNYGLDDKVESGTDDEDGEND